MPKYIHRGFFFSRQEQNLAQATQSHKHKYLDAYLDM